jgi:pimeloyl-ACP methyl ester carboxylesterase
MHREADLLPALHEKFGVARAHWLGHCDGGSIALIAAARYPGLAASLILEAPHVFVEAETLTSIAEIGARYAARDMAARMRRYHADPDHTFGLWNAIWLDPAFADWNIESLLAGLRTPALLIHGDDDEYGTPRQFDRIAALLEESHRLELDACGHSPHRDREDAVLAAVRGFLGPKD